MDASAVIMGFPTLREASVGFNWSQCWDLFDGNKSAFNLAHECIDRHLRTRAHDVAVRLIGPQIGQVELTFGELALASSAVAGFLQERGVKRGDGVVVHLEPGLHWLAAMFGILRVGGVFIPVNPLLGTDALAIRLSDAVARAAISDGLKHHFGDVPVWTSADIGRAIETGNRVIPAVATRAADPAIYTYSSGSTGRPKRTVLQHQAFTYLAVIIGKFVLDLKPQDRYIACYASGWLGGFGWGVILPLALGTGAGLYSGRLDPEFFLDKLRVIDVDVLHCPPTVYRRLLPLEATRDLSVRTLA